MERRMETSYGRLEIDAVEALFAATVARMEETIKKGRTRTIALTGGSTPKAFYAWAATNEPFSDEVLKRAVWTTSDERMVPQQSDDSNFGVADRGMLIPLDIPAANKMPWAVVLDPHAAVSSFNDQWEKRFGGDVCFDLCLLGMGDDGHTASIFPGSPLLSEEIPENFTCIDVPGKGWRLSITRAGLSRCREILITVMGAKKAAVLKAVLEGPDGVYPVQMLSEWKDRVTWLVDPEAAAVLKF